MPNILLVSKTPVAGAPVHLSGILNRYSPFAAQSVLQSNFTDRERCHLRWDYDYTSPSPEQMTQLLDWADLVVHNNSWWKLDHNRPECILYHSVPDDCLPLPQIIESSIHKLVIAQHPARYYSDAIPVPNLIDIWSPSLRPRERDDKRLTLFMGVASETVAGWGRKGSTEVREVFSALEKEHGSRVRTLYMKGRPLKEVYSVKGSADIVIDDCVTGAYHLSSLEGLAFGAVTVNHMDSLSAAAMQGVCGSQAPFLRTPLKELFHTLNELIRDLPRLRAKQLESRQWVEQHWDPARLVSQYTQQFSRLISAARPLTTSRTTSFPRPPE